MVLLAPFFPELLPAGTFLGEDPVLERRIGLIDDLGKIQPFPADYLC